MAVGYTLGQNSSDAQAARAGCNRIDDANE